ncbi:MAG: Gfo/Idh/MocA family oxidoreductase [Verrucomicrobiales bacterium]|nr:Gfo/Idh/MocA family oxidoreductase [Verrucomicrobiales bacterium]
MTNNRTRRNFLKTSTGALAAPYIGWKTAAAGFGPNETVHLASFGGGGRAAADLKGFAGVPGTKIVAFCDLDPRRAGKSVQAFPDAKIYTDWREMLDEEADNFVGTGCGVPDHMHAPMALSAMELGKHVYVQKPLTRTIYEARRLREVAEEKGLATQMGNQHGSRRSNLTAVKILQDGIIGKVQSVHSMNPKKWGSMSPLPDSTDQVPAGFEWDLWCGVQEPRRYVHGEYHPSNWRKRLDFGTSTLGDMGCHIYHPWFKGLGDPTPISVVSHGPAPVDADSWPVDWKVTWKMKSSEQGDFVATWYDGANFPEQEVLDMVGGKDNVPKNGSVVIGSDGALTLPHASNKLPTLYRDGKAVPDAFEEIPDDSHFKNWIEGIRSDGKKETVSGFSHSGPVTEAVLLGTIAVKFPKTELTWDSIAGRFTNSDKANEFVKPTYRKNWTVSLF